MAWPERPPRPGAGLAPRTLGWLLVVHWTWSGLTYWGLALIPIAWTVVGGSAAMLFGVYADLALPVAGLLAVVSLVTRRHRVSAS